MKILFENDKFRITVGDLIVFIIGLILIILGIFQVSS